ncbi:hypothetical protein RJ640_023187 [Escallonia rubra]|uniref:BHLH domain-containing protein n=1 Tax=Escallonia rubra TaxID=112253 RepID=A0AA88UIW5_9ASTE|nr:hypothetical protein RJ640_023187 [Escallonia rubra]
MGGDFFQDTDFGENSFAGSASLPDDIFSILEALEGVSSEFSTPMTLPEETANNNLVPQKSTGSSGLPECSENELEGASPKRKRQKVVNGTMAAAALSDEAANLDNGQQKISHITVERNRRKQMNEHLMVLRSLMPCFYVKRGDQASIIGGVVDYINELQQVLQSLEAKKQRKVYSEVLSPRIVSSPRPSPLSPRKPPLSPRPSLPISPRTPQPTSPYKPRLHQQGYLAPTMVELSPSSSSTNSSINDAVNELVANSKSAIADVEVKFSGANVLLKTVSPPIPGQAMKIIATLEDLSLEILDASINTIDEAMLVNSFTIKVRPML